MAGIEWLLGAAGAVLVAIVAAFLKGRSAGREDERQRQRDAELEARRTRERTDEDVGRLSDGDVRDELRGWTRD